MVPSILWLPCMGKYTPMHPYTTHIPPIYHPCNPHREEPLDDFLLLISQVDFQTIAKLPCDPKSLYKIVFLYFSYKFIQAILFPPSAVHWTNEIFISLSSNTSLLLSISQRPCDEGLVMREHVLPLLLSK